MRKHLLNLLNQFSSRRILVIGDLIADEFIYGSIARVSREAPVLVLEYREPVRLPGGAANAANNLLDLGCSVSIAGAVGRDDSGSNLIRSLREKGAYVQNIRKIRDFGTPVKTRILAGAPHSVSQQIVRLDRLQAPDSNPKFFWKILAQEVEAADAVILSDYGYGNAHPSLVARLAPAAAEKGIPLVVDSRFRMSEFCGVTSITPNITELEASVGISIDNNTELLNEIGQRVLREQSLKSLLVTQGRFGMTLFTADSDPLHIPVFGTDEIADVTGAGDTVIAIFTLALACGSIPEHAARLANYGGGIVVMKRGTATVSLDELRAAVQKDL
jgi:rfaE bifunctional protein kinase chain/domain